VLHDAPFQLAPLVRMLLGLPHGVLCSAMPRINSIASPSPRKGTPHEVPHSLSHRIDRWALHLLQRGRPEIRADASCCTDCPLRHECSSRCSPGFPAAITLSRLITLASGAATSRIRKNSPTRSITSPRSRITSCEGASQSLGFFGRRGSSAPGGVWKVPVEPRRIASTESAGEMICLRQIRRRSRSRRRSSSLRHNPTTRIQP
jgi:hypothetical protein